MVTSILEHLKYEPAPIIDQDCVTFVWKGRKPPSLGGDFTGWDENNPAVMKKSEPGVWSYQVILPSDAYIEYGFSKNGENILDPYNPRTTPNGIGGINNYFFMPDYKPTDLAGKDSKIIRGTVTRHKIPCEYYSIGKYRTVQLYHPPVKEPVPLVVVLDGQDYLYRMHLNYIVDKLISQDKLRPIALAFVYNGGPKARTLEYACNDATIAFLMLEVIPFARKQLKLIDVNEFPGRYGILGASMGGLMALYAGARVPDVFGNVLSQSGAFSWGSFDMAVFDLLQQDKNGRLKIWMDVGQYDLAGLLDANQRMQKTLTERGYQVSYREYHAGHNYPAWKDEIWRGLEALYGVER